MPEFRADTCSKYRTAQLDTKAQEPLACSSHLSQIMTTNRAEAGYCFRLLRCEVGNMKKYVRMKKYQNMGESYKKECRKW